MLVGGYGGVGIYLTPTYGALIESTMILVRYLKLLELLNLFLPPSQLISYYGGRWRASGIASTGYMAFTLGMYYD